MKIINYQLNLSFDPLLIDWEGKEKNIGKNSMISITSTPIFLLGNIEEDEENSENSENSKTSGFVVFLEVVGIILLIVILAIVGLYCYKKYIKKKYVPIDKNFFSSLLK